MNKLKSTMASKRKAHKYWKGLENTISESKKVMEEQGVDILPSQKELIELGYSCLNIAISRYHGGFHNFREKHLGEELLRKPSGYYTLENTISESKKVMEGHGFDTLPSSNKLRELGYSGLSRAISIHHSGFPNFREIINQELGIKSKVNQFMFTSIENLPFPGYQDNTQEDRKHFREIMNQELGIKSNKEHLTEIIEDYIKD